MDSFLYTVAADLWMRFGDDLRHVAVVFNNKRPIVFLKKHLAKVSGRTIWSPSLFTVAEFFAQSSDRAPSSEISRFFLLWQAYNELLAAEGQEEISAESFLPMAEIMLRDFDTLDYDLVDPKAIYRHLRDLAVISQQFEDFTEEQQAFLHSFWSSFSREKQAAVQQKFIELWQRLPALYELFRAKMEQQSLAGTASVYRDLAEGRAPNPGFINEYLQVAFVGFNALNKCEAALFKRWQESGKALFYFDADSYYVEDGLQEAGMFLRRNIRFYGLNNALGPFPDLLNDPKKHIVVYPIEGHVAQAKSLGKILQPGMASEEDNPVRCAVILADEQLLIPVLQTVPDRMKINVTMGFPWKQSPVFGLISLWISIQEHLYHSASENIKRSDALAYFNHPLTAVFGKQTEDLIAMLSSGNHAEVDPASLRISEESTLFFTGYESPVAGISGLQQLISLIVARKEHDHTLHLLESALLLQVYQVLNTLKDELIAFEQPGFDLGLSFIRRYLSGITATLEGAPLEGLQIMGMLESRCLDFDEVIILGANEGILPKQSLSPTFIPDSLRRAFGLPVVENQDALSAYLFYRLLQRANKIRIVYNALVDNHSSGEVSRFVQQLRFESRLHINSFPQRQMIRLVPSGGRKISIVKTAEVMERLNQYLVRGGKALSASALKLYLECPLRFFLKYVAGIKEPDLPPDPLDASVIGSAFHILMQWFYEPWLQNGKTVGREDIYPAMASIGDLSRKALSQVLFQDAGKLKHPDSQQRIAQSIIEENARLVLNYDALRVAPFRLIELENKENYISAFPITRNGAPASVNLYAVIDRVDEVQGGKRIVDYKTGNDDLQMESPAALFDRKTKGNPAAFQALLYSWIYRQVKREPVTPHLYVLRKLSTSGSSLKGKSDPEAMMPEFEAGLKGLLEELFDPHIPFEHNPQSKYCDRSAYATFCTAGSMIAADDGQDPFL